jgi:calcineurin-like phosphoesterase family protein
MKFFTADCHFNHKLPIKKKLRPFSSVEEMNEALIFNWNNKIRTNDDIYIVGDFAFGNAKPILEQLNGYLHLVPGDHDASALKWAKLFVNIDKIMIIKEQGQVIIACHWPFFIWPRSHYNAWQIHGHTHDARTYPRGKSYNVGVDANDFTPISFDELKLIMDAKGDNPNLICKTCNNQRWIDVFACPNCNPDGLKGINEHN